MHAIIFDIDGTLLDSYDVAVGMMSDAIRTVLGDVRLRDSWGMYECVTDTGVLAGVAQDNARVITPAETRAIEDAFMVRLTGHVQTHGPFPEIPGARDYVSNLAARSDVCIAYATGAWRAAATLKLASSGFPLSGIPLATADDHHDRTQIMRRAFAQLPQSVESITYYGDGAWDQAATSKLGWRFIPVGARLGGLTRFDTHATQF